MRLPLKLALSAVLAKTIVGELVHSPQAQQLNRDLSYKNEAAQKVEQQQQTSFDDQEETFDESAYPSENQYQVQDPVQQYAASFGGGNNGQPLNNHPYAAYSGGHAYPDAQGYSNSYGPPVYNAAPYHPGGFHVETGVEGFLVPAPPSQTQQVAEPRVPPSIFSTFTRALSTALPTSMRSTLSFLGRSVSIIVGLLSMTILGGGITTAICSYTPLCTISFAVPLLGVRRNAEKLAADYLGNENFEKVQKAINTFGKMQAEEMSVQSEPKDEAKTADGFAQGMSKTVEKDSPNIDIENKLENEKGASK